MESIVVVVVIPTRYITFKNFLVSIQPFESPWLIVQANIGNAIIFPVQKLEYSRIICSLVDLAAFAPHVAMGLLPDTYNCWLRMRPECRECFSRACYQPGLASRHVRAARAVMHAGIANWWVPLKSVAGKTFQAFPAHVQPAILRIW